MSATDEKTPTPVHHMEVTDQMIAAAREAERAVQAALDDFELIIERIDAGINKAGAIAMLQRAGIRPPRTYGMGFPNANCLKTGCVKATSPDYWSLFRLRFPERFAAMAERSRRIGAKLTRINDERMFIDEIPGDWPTLNPEAPICDFLCILAEQGLEDAA